MIPKPGTLAHEAREVTTEILSTFNRIGYMRKPLLMSLLKDMMEAYATASFGHECDRNITLDEGDILMPFMEEIASMLGMDLGFYMIEELYSHPIMKDETPAARASALMLRNENQYRNQGAINIALFMTKYHGKTKKAEWWRNVAEAIHQKTGTPLKLAAT